MSGRTAGRTIGVLITCLALAGVFGCSGAAAATNPSASCAGGTLLYLGVGGLRVASLPSCTSGPVACADGCEIGVAGDYGGKWAGTSLRWQAQRNTGTGWSTVASGTCGPGFAPCGNVYGGGPYEGASSFRVACSVHTTASLTLMLGESEACRVTAMKGPSLSTEARTSRATGRKSARARTRSRLRARAR